jgi:hypothetical protein
MSCPDESPTRRWTRRTGPEPPPASLRPSRAARRRRTGRDGGGGGGPVWDSAAVAGPPGPWASSESCRWWTCATRTTAAGRAPANLKAAGRWPGGPGRRGLRHPPSASPARPRAPAGGRRAGGDGRRRAAPGHPLRMGRGRGDPRRVQRGALPRAAQHGPGPAVEAAGGAACAAPRRVGVRANAARRAPSRERSSGLDVTSPSGRDGDVTGVHGVIHGTFRVF